MPKCPICETEYSNNHRMCDELRCTECYWDLTTYPLTSDGLRQEQENRLEWAIGIWKELQDLKDVDEYQALIKSNDDLQERLELEINKQDRFTNEFNAKIKELENKINYLLSEPDRLELRRCQLVSRYDCRDSNEAYRDERKLTAYLPFKIAEVIKNNKPKSKRDDNRNLWLNKVIIEAVIKEGWLEEATLYQLESYKKLENNKVYFVIFQEYKSALYLILKDKLLYSHKNNVDIVTFDLFLKSNNKSTYSNHPEKTIFSNYKNYKYLTALDESKVHYLLEDLVGVGLEECKKYYSSFFSRLERHVGEIKKYNNLSTESLHWLVK